MKILQIISSPRGGASFSKKLGQGITEKLQAANPGSTVQVRDLATHPFPHLEEAKLNALFTPVEKRTPEQHEAVKHSDDAIAEVMAADVLIVEAPLYNFGIPSTLKAWIDHIVRAGITFRYSAEGRPEGLVKGKKLYVAVASGGVYSDGPMVSYDFVAPYLKTVFSFLGFTDIDVVRVEGTSMPGVQDTALEKALASVHIGAAATA